MRQIRLLRLVAALALAAGLGAATAGAAGAQTTTTTSAPTTTAPQVPSIAVTQAPGADLAETGISADAMVPLGFALIGLGAVLQGAARRPRVA